jgi:hypothetical protein
MQSGVPRKANSICLVERRCPWQCGDRRSLPAASPAFLGTRAGPAVRRPSAQWRDRSLRGRPTGRDLRSSVASTPRPSRSPPARVTMPSASSRKRLRSVASWSADWAIAIITRVFSCRTATRARRCCGCRRRLIEDCVDRSKLAVDRRAGHPPIHGQIPARIATAFVSNLSACRAFTSQRARLPKNSRGY